MIHTEEKIYEVEFLQYTNCMKDAVWCEDDDTYMDIPKNSSLLVKESDLSKYQKFGGGYKSTKFVGMLVPSNQDD